MYKIAHLTSAHHLNDPRIFYKECKTLKQAGYEVVLIVPHDKDEIVDGIRVRAVPIPGGRVERMTLTTSRIFKAALSEHADLYHIHDPELIPWARLLHLIGSRVMYDMHENLPKQIMNKYWINPIFRSYLAKLITLTERIFLTNMPVIFAEQSYHDEYSWIKRHETIFNFPLVNQLLKIRCDVQKSENLNIGYIGGVTELRGSVMMVKALKILRDNGINFNFECVGPIDEFHKACLQALCEKYQIRGVNFYGWINPEQAWLKIARCHVGLVVLQPILNYVESYPTKMFEYMALGRPVIASDFSLYRQIIQTHQCGLLVDPRSPDQIANAIQWVFEHPEEAIIMGENGIKAIQNIFNWDIEAKKLLKFYNEILYFDA